MNLLPVRGAAVRTLGLRVPPARMPLFRGTRPRKRWRYVGYYGPDLMLCVADARIGPVPKRWWAVALRGGDLHERTTIGRSGVIVERGTVEVERDGVRIHLTLGESGGIETASPTSAGHYIWTRKTADVPAARLRGCQRAAIRDRRHRLRRRERGLPRPAHGLEVVRRQRPHE